MPDHEEEFTLAELLRTIGHGDFHTDATVAIKDIVRHLQQSGSASPKGEINIKIKFKLDRGVMDVDPSFKVTVPSPVRARSILYPGRDGSLHRNNQEQMMLPGTEVRSPNANPEVRSATEAPREERVVEAQTREANISLAR